MHIRLILVLSLFWLSQTYANEARPPIASGTEGLPATAGDVDQKPTARSTPTAPKSDRDPAKAILAPAQRLATPTGPNIGFSDSGTQCVRPGDLIKFSIQDATIMETHRLVIKVDNELLALKTIVTNTSQAIAQLLADERIKQNESYLIVLQDKQNPISYETTSLRINVCSLNTNQLELQTQADHEPNQLVLYVKSNTALLIEEELRKLSNEVVQKHVLAGLDSVMLTIKIADGSLSYALKKLRSRFPDAVIDVNSLYEASNSPRLFSPEMIAWPDYPESCPAPSNLVIGLIDGMIDKNHPALTNQDITVKDFLYSYERPDIQHGTAIAAILAGDNTDQGYQGLLSGISILGASVLRVQQDKVIATTESIVRAVDWLLSSQVRLVNISLSGNEPNLVTQSVFKTAVNKGMIFFSAAGNNGKTANPSFPAALDGVISVTAIDAAKRIYSEANQGDYIDFSAPGVDIWTIDDKTKGKYSSGTSFAVPHALAVAALYLKKNPSLPREILYRALQENSHDLGDAGHDRVFGWGLVQAPQQVCN